MRPPVGIISQKTGNIFVNLPWIKIAEKSIGCLSSNETAITFVGETSCGKSTAVSWTVKHLMDINPSVKIVILDAEDILILVASNKDKDKKYEAVITSLVQALLPMEKLNSLDTSGCWRKDYLIKVLQDNLQKNPVIFVLDDLDKLGEATSSRVLMLMRLLMKEAAYNKNHLAVVVSCSQKSSLPNLNSDFYDYFDVIELEDKLSETQIGKLASEFGLKITSQDKDNIEKILKSNVLLVHNLFYWYAQYLRENNPNQINISEWVKTLPENSSSEGNFKEFKNATEFQSFLKVYQRYTGRTKKDVTE